MSSRFRNLDDDKKFKEICKIREELARRTENRSIEGHDKMDNSISDLLVIGNLWGRLSDDQSELEKHYRDIISEITIMKKKILALRKFAKKYNNNPLCSETTKIINDNMI